MKIPRFLLILGAALGLVAAPTFASGGATIVSLQGDVKSSAGALQVGSLVPAGVSISTGAGGEVSLRTFEGTVTTLQGDSELLVSAVALTNSGGATKETTTFELRRGGLIASLDPAKKSVNDYSVRTPRGVAYARGTLFAVRVTQDRSNATVATMTGTVTFVTDRGEVTVAFGQVTSANSGVMSVNEAIAADPSLKQLFVDAAGSVSAAVGNGAIANTGGTPNLAAAVLAAVTQIAVQAAPESRAQIQSTVLANVGGAGSGLAAVVTQAAGGNGPAGNGNGKGNGAQTILPALDQTQVIVSPSRP
jgi:hypothetical protein